MEQVKTSECEASLVDMVQGWLERTPGLEKNGFNFWGKYQEAVETLLQEQKELAEASIYSFNHF